MMGEGLGRRTWLRGAPRLLLAGGALALMATTPNFLRPGTLGAVLALGSIVGVLAIGQAFVLVGGGFDLAQGASMALSAAVAATLATKWGLGPAVAAPAAILAGAALGAINGLCVAALRLNPFVATLSTMMIYRGAAFVLLGGLPIANVRAFDWLDRGPTLGRTLLPARGFVFLALAGVAAFVLSRTVFGRHVYAVGGNERAARLSGLPTIRLKVATFAIGGAAAGLAALMQLSWVRVAKPDTGYGLELDSIAACVVGGISLRGGSGHVLGAAAGCLLLQALGTYITMSGFPDEYRSVATGAVILTFAAADALARREG